jgi:histidine triad (HIT) family protein
MISHEQLEKIRDQLLIQLETLEEPQKSQLQSQIESMNDQELEEFLIKNNIINIEKEGSNSSNKTECIFCSIVQGKIPSYKLTENKEAIAILEINPISEGHTIIVPKMHNSQDEIPSSAFSLAKKVAEKIKKTLKPKKVDLITGEMFNHGIINVLPVYESEHLGMQRKKATEDKLKDLQSKLEFKEKPVKPKREKPKEEVPISKLPKAPHIKA